MDEQLAEQLVRLAVEVKKLTPDCIVTILCRDTESIDGDHILITADKLPDVIEALEDLQKVIKD